MADDDFWELEESTDLVEQEESTDVIILEEGEGVAGEVTTPAARIMAVALGVFSCNTAFGFRNVVKEKTPESKLDFKFDWKSLTNGSGSSNWLQDSETITGATVTTPSGITGATGVLSDTASSVIVWLSGGTISNQYSVTCRIETNLGRIEVATMIICMVENKSG